MSSRVRPENWDDDAWMGDTALASCTPATRGVWKDLLIAMRRDGCTGELRGTTEQLARLARCSAADLSQALTDLQTTGAADVTDRNGVVTVVNRRMSRMAEARKRAAERQRKHREAGVSQISCADVFGKDAGDACDTPISLTLTPLEEFSLSSGEEKPQKKKASFVKPTIEEVRAYVSEMGYTFDAEEFWHHYEGCGWVYGRGKPVTSWKSCCTTWSKRQDRFNGNRHRTDKNASPGQRFDPAGGLGAV